ncbi:MAG: UvrD-helicase domain-containing protein [Oscillospiraceae bacterium]|jgi:DNA helicase-2/ATP-dependent DNA helicase PcrA|nr:UvrD-helicase domain-containing protein [Oscillospiraceae bacterium]
MTASELRERFAAARRRFIEREFSDLNEMQRDAALATEGPLLILAGAGSGKTTVLINRIANLLSFGRASDSSDVPEYVTRDDLEFIERYNDSPRPDSRDRAFSLCEFEPVAPWRIIAITFTNKAAGEIKERLERRLGPEALDIWAMTFHSACVRILRHDIEALGYSRSFAIYDASDSVSLMKRVIRDLNLDDKSYPPRAVLSAISRAKDALISARDFFDDAQKSGDVRRRNTAKAYMEYENRLRAANALDFDDLLLLAVRLLREHEDVRQFYQSKFQYVMIDEYQDTNNLQYMLAELLAGGHRNICVVGDDDQSIYKFRGATIENILNFESKYKNARLIRLEENYRSTSHILAAANDVISNNTGRRGKKLWTRKTGGDAPTVHIAPDERGEARFIADSILALVSAGGKWSDSAVLYRMNAQSNQLEYAFKGYGIPYRVVGGTSFYERAEIKDMLSYLCVVNNPADDLRLLRIINTPPRGIGQRTIELLTEIAVSENAAIFTTMQNSASYAELQKASPKLLGFCGIIEALRLYDASPELPELYDALLERSGYVRALEERRTEENISRIENVRELKTNILNYINENPDGSLNGFLSETALYTDLDRGEDGLDRAVLMTMHSAKGLEFDNVFIAGADEGIFPGMRAIGDPVELEEERRLCYVAITRARKTLCFVSARRRMLFGKTAPGKLSRFVEEIDDEHIVKPRSGRANIDIVFDDTEYETGHAPPRGSRYPPPARRRAGAAQAPAPAKQKPPAENYRPGDTVEHKLFGRGLVTLAQSAGNDALLEIAFDTAGTKRFMRNSVSQYLKRV